MLNRSGSAMGNFERSAGQVQDAGSAVAIGGGGVQCRGLSERRALQGRARKRKRSPSHEPDGARSDCSVISSSGSKDLDEATCSILRNRARYKPALDTDGKPTPSFVIQNIVWETSNLLHTAARQEPSRHCPASCQRPVATGRLVPSLRSRETLGG